MPLCVLKLVASLSELLSRLRQLLSQLGRYFSDLLCQVVLQLSELHQNFYIDDVQLVVEFMIHGLLWASGLFARLVRCLFCHQLTLSNPK